MLNDLDLAIQQLESQLDPGTSNYRYNAMRLDVLRLQREAIEIRELVKDCEVSAEATGSHLESLKLKISILECTLTLLCKPESRDMIAAKVAEHILQRWQANRERDFHE